MYASKSIKTYLDDLAARKPAPGGGSAAALAGALGCALLSMVCNFTIGKDKYKSVEPQIKKILRKAERLRQELLELADLDVSAYYKVFNSRKGPAYIYQKNLIRATDIPFKTCRFSLQAYKFCPLLLKIANEYLLSDIYVAQELLKSSFKSGELNVKINLPLIKNKKFVLSISGSLKRLKKEIK